MPRKRVPELSLRNCRIGVIGLGYVGLPLAVEFGKHYETTGFDINPERIAELRAARTARSRWTPAELRAAKRLRFTSELKDLKACRVYVVTVPTPIDADKRPDLGPLERASETVGRVLKRGDIVIYESTVFPGCTEEICVPILERRSGLKFNRDFFAGYSPERINPGDREHRLPTIRKVTSGSTPEAAAFVDKLYGSIVKAGTHPASSIRVAEAAKVIENTQRDVNIALDQRARHDLQPARHRHPGGARGGGQQVELPAVPAGPGRRALHRRRPVLPDAQGAADRLPPGDDPRGPAHQRQHGAVRRGRGRAPDGGEAHPREVLAHPGDGPRVQGEHAGPPELEGRRPRRGARPRTAPRSTCGTPG